MGAEAHRIPAYQGVVDRPRAPHAPQSHVPQRRGLGILATLGITTIVALAAKGAIQKSTDATTPGIRPGAADPEQMSYPYYEQLLNVAISSDGNPVEEWTTKPQVLRAGDSFYVPVLVPSYGDPNDPENRFGHITIVMLNEVIQGGAMLRESDVNGNAIVGPNGEPNFINPDQVENLLIPEQTAPKTVIG